MEYIREKYKQFIKGHEDDEDWIHDMTDKFVCTLSKRERAKIMLYLELTEQYTKNCRS